MKRLVYVLSICAVCVLAQDNFENAGVRVALKIYDDCTNAEIFSSCLKKKAITFLDRLGRFEKFSLIEGVSVVRGSDASKIEPTVTEEQIEKNLPRSNDAQNEVLNTMLLDKFSKYIGSRTLEINIPKYFDENLGTEEGRKGGGGGGGGGGKGGMKGMMGGMMMGIAAKMAALIPVAIAGLFLLAGKALITAKIALLLSGIIAIKKLFAAKQGGGGGGGGAVVSSGHGHGWQSSGHGGGGGGGWQSSGGGWDKRSIDSTNSLAYSAYSPK